MTKCSRRGGRLALSLVILALAASLLVATGSAASAATKASSGGDLSYAIPRVLTCIDPQVTGDTNAVIVDRTVVDSLVSVDSKGKINPWLATKWTISPDLKTYTFTLKQGVKFSDGTPFNATAVKANFDRIVDPKTASQRAKSFMGPYVSTDVVDDYTAKVNFSAPNSSFLTMVGTTNLGMLSPTAFASKNMCNGPIGSGPFVISDFEPTTKVVQDRNAKYAWGPQGGSLTGAAKLDHLTFLVVADPTVRAGLVGAGQADAVDTVLPTQIDTLPPDVKITKIPQRGISYGLFFNLSSAQAPWTDVPARQAFRDSLDINSIIKTLYQGVYPRAWGPLTPATPGYNPKVENSWKYDLKKANKEFDKLGYTTRDSDGYRTKDGKTLTVQWPTYSPQPEQRSDVQVFVQQQAKLAGVKVVIDSKPTSQYLQDLMNGTYDLSDFSSVSPSPDVLRQSYDSSFIPTPKGIQTNFSRLNDPTVDDELVQALGTPAGAAQTKIYDAFQMQVVNNVWMIPVYVPTRIIAANSKVQNLVGGGEGIPLFYYASISK